jgi:hypothetical protein
MHATHVLDKHLRIHCQETHQKRMDTVLTLVKGLLTGKVLTVTGLGRSIQGSSAPKHQIKKADRMIGNHHLHNERHSIYRALALLMIGKLKRPVILVDWSDITADSSIQKLRASFAVEGRGLTLYEEVHFQVNAGTQRVHVRFLKTLQSLLPAHCNPIIVTDAGFKNPWFKAVKALGWDFIGRVGGHIMIKHAYISNEWIRVERVFETSTSRARYYGAVDLVLNNPLFCHAYTLKRKPTGRIKKNRFGRKSAAQHSKKNAHRERTPWLLVTSLEGGSAITKTVINLYKTRMQIEEAFRDLKSHRYGFSFRDCMTRKRYRLENLLLIGALAAMVAWLVGKIAEMKNLHRLFQANTTRTRNVLSTIYLGCEVYASGKLRMAQSDFTMAIKLLSMDRYTAGLPA